VSELRQDGLSGRLVLVAPGRASRPHTNAPDGTAGAGGPATCPFCPGHEHQTPPELYRTGDGAPDTPGWRVRVVPNLYPIVGPDAAPGATGAHEVVVLSPAHDRSFGLLSDAEAIDVADVLRERARHHAAAGRRHVQALINSGRPAGASIAHPHAQLLALDIVPPAVLAAETRFAASDVLRADLDDAVARALLVIEGDDDHAPAWCPWAGSSPWVVRIATRDGGPRFEEAPDGQLHAVTRTLRRVLAVLASDLGDPAYNVVVQNAPAGEPAEWSRWYVEVTPRVSYVAGFELGTGLFVNSVAPEWAAGQYRETLA
jgi:UDPglucose--hexose-1-phosphate uridylyltransferase